MKSIIPAALAAVLLVSAGAASAQVGISVDFGDVAIGYRDGYWDSHHHWHHWHHASDWRHYRDMHPHEFHDYNHYRHR